MKWLNIIPSCFKQPTRFRNLQYLGRSYTKPISFAALLITRELPLNTTCLHPVAIWKSVSFCFENFKENLASIGRFYIRMQWSLRSFLWPLRPTIDPNYNTFSRSLNCTKTQHFLQEVRLPCPPTKSIAPEIALSKPFCSSLSPAAEGHEFLHKEHKLRHLLSKMTPDFGTFWSFCGQYGA